MSLLDVQNLHVNYRLPDGGEVQAVRDVSFTIEQGETVGIVGESGCGKSTLAQALLRGLPQNGYIPEGKVLFDGIDLTELSNEEIKEHRWKDISMISQGAMASLDPVYKVGRQIREAIQTHEPDTTNKEALQRARELFELVGIAPDRVNDYPHQLSGGMRQRAIIAMSLALDPQLIIADEPTTALDVIVQKQILNQVKQIQRDINSSMMMITHDISVVAETCDKVLVMYGGELMEGGTTEEIFNDGHHPYTLGLQNAFPSIEGEIADLVSIPGSPPDLQNPPEGCPFQDRCPYSDDVCREPLPARQVSDSHTVWCHEPTPFEEIRRTSDDRELWQSTTEAKRQEVTYEHER
ncbi:MAG: ABC transporter ATP-binding protein [Haloglomus sp.]